MPSLLPLEPSTALLLTELLQAECRDWQSVLLWDYQESSEIIQQVARSGHLPGFVLTERGRAVGYCFWVPEGRRTLIGDVFVLPEWRRRGADAELVAAMLKGISLNGVRRVESQNISFGLEGAPEVYRRQGFLSYQRFFMVKRLAPAAPGAAGREPGAGRVVFRSYHSNDFTHLARLIYESYVGRPDSDINSQYSTYAGCKEFLSNLIKSTGCGRFLRALSLIAEDVVGKQVVGAVVTTEISPGNAHLPQISILPEFQGQGLGRKMIEVSCGRLSQAGYGTASLAVSAANTPAVKLYQGCGFESVLEFPVFVKDL